MGKAPPTLHKHIAPFFYTGYLSAEFVNIDYVVHFLSGLPLIKQ